MSKLPLFSQRQLLSILCLFLSLSMVSCSSTSRVIAASTVATGAVPTATTSADAGTTSGGGNPVFQMVGYVKDSVVRTVDGVGLMWKNYGRCNEIRKKQKQHRDALRVQWEDNGVPRDEIKKRIKSVNGGITYDEYAFLVKGKEDRGKLTQLMLLSWGAPRFLPYALMFYPEMLPSAFSPQKDDSSGLENKLQALSRERSHAVIQSLLNVERDARIIPAVAKLNIFGRKQQQLAMEKMDRISRTAASLLSNPILDSSGGAELILDMLEGDIYSDEELNAKSKRLVTMPKSIMKGLAQTIEKGGVIDAVLPNFVTRGKVLNHIRKITESDEFLVAQSVDLEELGTQRLVDACRDRLVCSMGKTNEEMREILAEWLQHAVVQPSERIQETGKFYNGNLARAALLGYNAVQSTKNDSSASYLPRSLFQGSSTTIAHDNAGDAKKK